MTLKPVAVLGYGNPSRGDDALAPLLLEHIQQKLNKHLIPDCFDLIDDFQLQIEHTLDMQGRSQILFIDASMNAKEPFEFSRIHAAQDDSISSHALSPVALLSVYEQVHHEPAPSAFLIAIPGYRFELGEALSPKAEANLHQAVEFCDQILINTDLAYWNSCLPA